MAVELSNQGALAHLQPEYAADARGGPIPEVAELAQHTGGNGSSSGQPHDLGNGRRFGRLLNVGNGGSIGRLHNVGNGSSIGRLHNVGNGSSIGQMRNAGNGSNIGQMRNAGNGNGIGRLHHAARDQQEHGKVEADKRERKTHPDEPLSCLVARQGRSEDADPLGAKRVCGW
ncbi:hypothetical protein ACQY0O_008470 [Thecaphora frezii]